MAFQAVPNTVAIDIIYDQHGEAMQNVFYALLPGGYILSDLVALAAAIDVQVDATWKAQQVIEAFYVRTEVRGLGALNDLLATNTTNAGVGALTAGALPNSVTFAVKKLSGLTGRSARGRTFWMGASSGNLRASNENEFQTAYVNDIVTAVDSIRLVIATVGLWEAVLVSRFEDNAPRPVGITFPWINSVAVDEEVDTQRGRLP